MKRGENAFDAPPITAKIASAAKVGKAAAARVSSVPPSVSSKAASAAKVGKAAASKVASSSGTPGALTKEVAELVASGTNKPGKLGLAALGAAIGGGAFGYSRSRRRR